MKSPILIYQGNIPGLRAYDHLGPKDQPQFRITAVWTEGTHYEFVIETHNPAVPTGFDALGNPNWRRQQNNEDITKRIIELFCLSQLKRKDEESYYAAGKLVDV